MDDNEQKSCWAVTAWAVAGFGAFIFVSWLASGAEATILAVN